MEVVVTGALARLDGGRSPIDKAKRSGVLAAVQPRGAVAAKIADLIVSHSEAEEKDEQDVYRGF